MDRSDRRRSVAFPLHFRGLLRMHTVNTHHDRQAGESAWQILVISLEPIYKQFHHATEVL